MFEESINLERFMSGILREVRALIVNVGDIGDQMGMVAASVEEPLVDELVRIRSTIDRLDDSVSMGLDSVASAILAHDDPPHCPVCCPAREEVLE